MDEMDELEFEAARTTGEPIESSAVSDSMMAFTYLPNAQRRWHYHRRLMINIVMIASVLLIVGALLLHTSVLPDLLNPTSSSLDSQARLILFTHTVPWGKLTIDGHVLSGVNDLTTLKPSLGQHSLRYTASPFPTIHCVFDVPASSADTCPLYHPRSQDFYPSSPARVFNLNCLPENLPAEQRKNLVQTIQKSLDSMATITHVMPDDHYASEDGHVLLSASSFPARLTYQVPAFVTQTTQAVCSLICLDSLTTGNDWQLDISIQPQWQYNLPGGQFITVSAPSIRADDTNVETILAKVRWTGSWSVSLSQVSMAACDLASSRVTELSASLPAVSVTSVIAPNPADGCLIVATSNIASSNNPAFVLFHFGVLLTANTTAHNLYPSLLQASPQEVAFAAHLATPHY